MKLPEDFVLPAYGQSTLSDLLPSIGAHLGVDGCRDDRLGLPSAKRYVVLLVDGLGHQLLGRSLRHLGWSSEVYGDALTLTAGIPSTTATSLTCLGTGCTPGEHGMAGYSFLAPGEKHAMNALTWEGGPSEPEVFQSIPTMFERAAATRVQVTSIGPGRFEGSGMTRAALRGAEFVTVDEADNAARITATVEASRRGEASLVYVYERHLDHTGHGKGVASQAWLDTLIHIDEFAGSLREALDDEVCLLVTGDHGMIDVPQANRVVAEDEPGLLDGVTLVAGEGRFRQFYTERPDAVAARWAERMGESAWVRTRAQAVAEGWFGPQVSKSIAERIGDVLVVLRDDGAIMTTTQPFEFGLVGMHGSLTDDEMRVPLLVA